jgi:hypothetical protein
MGAERVHAGALGLAAASTSGSSPPTRPRPCSTSSARTRRTSSSSATGGWVASEGQRLGPVPGAVVRDAVCDVLVVQTSALDEDRLFGRRPACG